MTLTAAVIWPKYCRYGVKHYIINQSINQIKTLTGRCGGGTALLVRLVATVVHSITALRAVDTFLVVTSELVEGAS